MLQLDSHHSSSELSTIASSSELSVAHRRFAGSFFAGGALRFGALRFGAAFIGAAFLGAAAAAILGFAAGFCF